MSESEPQLRQTRADNRKQTRQEGPIARGREALQQQPRFHFAYLLFALLGVFLLHDAWVSMRQVERIPYIVFHRFVDEGLVAEVGSAIRGACLGYRQRHLSVCWFENARFLHNV